MYYVLFSLSMLICNLNRSYLLSKPYKGIIISLFFFTSQDQKNNSNNKLFYYDHSHWFLQVRETDQLQQSLDYKYSEYIEQNIKWGITTYLLSPSDWNWNHGLPFIFQTLRLGMSYTISFLGFSACIIDTMFSLFLPPSLSSLFSLTPSNIVIVSEWFSWNVVNKSQIRIHWEMSRQMEKEEKQMALNGI